VAKKKKVHVIVDNYAAHKHPKVLEWIENHPRFVFHFIPTSAKPRKPFVTVTSGSLFAIKAEWSGHHEAVTSHPFRVDLRALI
jgi:hypothetical protein